MAEDSRWERNCTCRKQRAFRTRAGWLTYLWSGRKASFPTHSCGVHLYISLKPLEACRVQSTTSVSGNLCCCLFIELCLLSNFFVRALELAPAQEGPNLEEPRHCATAAKADENVPEKRRRGQSLPSLLFILLCFWLSPTKGKASYHQHVRRESRAILIVSNISEILFFRISLRLNLR